MEGFTAQKGLCNLVRGKELQERRALLKEEGDVIREYKAMHEEIVLRNERENRRTKRMKR